MDKEVARLCKVTADPDDDTHPAIDRPSGTAFSRRRYVLLCLALAALEQSGRQTTLGRIAQMIMQFVATDQDLQAAGLVFDTANHDQCRDLVHAVRFLIDVGILRRLDGNERQFLNGDELSDVLYDINRSVLAAILHASRSPSVVVAAQPNGVRSSLSERVDQLIDSPPRADDERDQHIRSRLVRTLLDDPILYFADLNESERSYFQAHSAYLVRQIHEATGLFPEIRREGIAMVDHTGDLTDVRLPDEGMDAHLSLLLAQWLIDSFKIRGEIPIQVSAVEAHVRRLIDVHGSRWRKEAREAGAERWLTQDALSRLRGLRLIQMTADGIVPLAACARYAAQDEE